MNFEHHGIFAEEKMLFGENVTVIIKDPTGLGRVLESEDKMQLVSHKEPEGSLVQGGEVMYHPADDGRPRRLTATINYLPFRNRTPLQELGQIHASFIRSNPYEPMNIVPAENDEQGNPGLALSVGEHSDRITMHVGSSDDHSHVTGLVTLELSLTYDSDPSYDESLMSNMLLAWGVAQSAMNTPKHLNGRRPLTIVVEGMSVDDHAHDLWSVVVDYAAASEIAEQRKDPIPELKLSLTDIEHLSIVYPVNATALVDALDYLIYKHMLSSSIGRGSRPITIYDIAEYFESQST